MVEGGLIVKEEEHIPLVSSMLVTDNREVIDKGKHSTMVKRCM